MIRKRLIAWQWESYPQFHASRANRALHLITVPLFWAATVALVPALALRAWGLAGVCLGAIVLALAAQGRGHRVEKNPPIPFEGPLDVVSRFFVEQWVNFPRYVANGGLGSAARLWLLVAPVFATF